MEEKGKTVTIESDEEKEGSMTYVKEIDLDEETIQPVRRPKYVPPSKGKAKVPTNLDDVDNILIIPSLPKGVPIGIRIHKLASGFREAQEEAVRIQLELSLQIVELKLQVQPSTPPEVTEQCKSIIYSAWEMITLSMKECIDLLAQSLI